MKRGRGCGVGERAGWLGKGMGGNAANGVVVKGNEVGTVGGGRDGGGMGDGAS